MGETNIRFLNSTPLNFNDENNFAVKTSSISLAVDNHRIPLDIPFDYYAPSNRVNIFVIMGASGMFVKYRVFHLEHPAAMPAPSSVC